MTMSQPFKDVLAAERRRHVLRRDARDRLVRRPLPSRLPRLPRGEDERADQRRRTAVTRRPSRRRCALGGVTRCGPWAQGPGAANRAEVIAEIRVHGNHVTSDDEVAEDRRRHDRRAVRRRRRSPTSRSGSRTRASSTTIDVLKRFASIEDPSKIAVVIIVNEGRGADRVAGRSRAAKCAIVKRRVVSAT